MRWFAEIADFPAKYPLLMVMRDNAGEISAKTHQKELSDFFTENGLQWSQELFQHAICSMAERIGIVFNLFGKHAW